MLQKYNFVRYIHGNVISCGFQRKYYFMRFPKKILFYVVSKKILCISCGIQRKSYLMWFPTKILFHAVSKENTLLCGFQRKYYVFHVASKDNIVLFLFAENIIFRGFQKLYFMWLEKKILLD